MPPEMTTPESRFQDVRVCRSPVFVVGSPRSGTTILATALGQHGDLWYGAEGHVLNHLFGQDRLDETYVHGYVGGGRWLEREGVTREEFWSGWDWASTRSLPVGAGASGGSRRRRRTA
ncbi:MAG: sulfotransferase [Chloroflexota bacterium]